MSSFAKALSPALREIRILCCQTAQASAGTRQFVVSEYPIIKKHNPDLPVLIREATGTPSRVFARFGAFPVRFRARVDGCTKRTVERGVEKHVELDNLSSSEVASKIAQLLSVS
ncbi:NDUFA2, NADH ubiquinone oxidoreductase 10.5kD subunit [Butyriboletus roseoflavus]|nr:NDUFA2, NADH ubiquinone oxidoreductase 10.5kD subunit [Butyriboletus roseoflavus]